MKPTPLAALLRLTVIGTAFALMAGSASADKPGDTGGGKHKEWKETSKKNNAGDHDRDGERRGNTVFVSFGANDRVIITEYYGQQARKGKCPPGLAKKRNGCQAPGKAKMWNKGLPLSRDVTYYEVPRELRVRLPAPPPNHRYVEVAGNILMIAVGTRMVVDAVENILQ